MTSTEITFGDYAAEPRTDGYYLRHANGGGAMATLVEVALIKELIEGREEWAAMKFVADCSDDMATAEAMELVQFRQAIAAALPDTWYTDAPLEQRVRLLVNQWQKLHLREQQVAKTLAALRAEYAKRSMLLEKVPIEWRAAFSVAVTDLDNTIAALGLPEPTAKENNGLPD